MKKLTSVLLFISFFSVITFSSCKNLFSSEDFLKTLNKAIEYSNAEYVTVTIDAPNSFTDSVTPSAGIHATEYKCGDTFTLSFVPGTDFYFTKWTVTPENAVTFAEPYNSQTLVTINVEGVIVIKPEVAKRPHVVASTPVYERAGVNGGSDINVLFDTKMSVESIYWTKAELLTIEEQEKAEKFTYTTFEVPDIKDSNGNKYYYAYQTENAGIKTKKYKNIEIKVRGTEISLLDGNYFGCPYFEETMLTLVIPVAGSENGKFDQVPPRSDIEFTILKEFCSENKVGIPANYSACYHTNGDFDNSKPVYTAIGTRYNFIIAGVVAESNKQREDSLIPASDKGILTKWRNSNPPANYSAQDFMTITDINEYLNNAGLDDEKICRVCKHANKINLTAGKITDNNPNDTGISEVTLTLTPVKNAIYPKQSANVYKVTTEYSGVDEINLSKTFPITFDLSTINTEGIFSVAISITDGVGHKTEVPVKLIYGTADGQNGNVAPYTPYCIVDNVVEEDTVSEILSNLSEERGGSTPYRVLSEGPVGYYALCIMGEKTMKKGDMERIEDTYDFKELKYYADYWVNPLEEKINNRQIYCWNGIIWTETDETIYHKVLYYSDIFGNVVLIPLD